MMDDGEGVQMVKDLQGSHAHLDEALRRSEIQLMPNGPVLRGDDDIGFFPMGAQHNTTHTTMYACFLVQKAAFFLYRLSEA